MISDPNRLTEGMGSFLGGANSAVDPALIGDTQYSWAENVVVRDGYPTTRPGFRYVKPLPSGVVQGLCYFENKNKDSQDLISLIDGKLYDLLCLEPNKSPLDISPPNEPANLYISQKACLVQANFHLIAQDGLSKALVYDGIKTFRSKQKLEPVSENVPTVNISVGAGSSTTDYIVISEVNNAGPTPQTTVFMEFPSELKANMIPVGTEGTFQPGTFVASVEPISSTQVGGQQRWITRSRIVFNVAPIRNIVNESVKFYAPGSVIEQDVSIPIGSVMCYGNGRLWVANGNNLYAGDLVGTSKDSEIKFSETIYLTGGGSFGFPNKITGLEFLPGSDSSTGLGDLIVFTQNDIYAIRATVFNRDLWQNTSGMQRQIFRGRGSANQESIIQTDRDVYFRSVDGIRSLAQSLQSSGIVSLSDSLEATRVTGYDTEWWLSYCPGVLFDSRYLIGAAPKIQKIKDVNGNYTKRFNHVFTKLVSKDFNAGALAGSPVPAYDGEWNGLQICKLVEGLFKGERKCFAVTCDEDGRNSLYEITLDGDQDLYRIAGSSETIETPIECSVETRRFSFDSPFDIKTLVRADLGFSEVFENISWSLGYNPDFLDTFYSVQTGSVENNQNTPVLTTPSPPDLIPGFKTSRTVKPVSVKVDATNRLSNFGYMFQTKISWEGRAKLVLFRLHAARRDTSDLGEC